MLRALSFRRKEFSAAPEILAKFRLELEQGSDLQTILPEIKELYNEALAEPETANWATDDVICSIVALNPGNAAPIITAIIGNVSDLPNKIKIAEFCYNLKYGSNEELRALDVLAQAEMLETLTPSTLTVAAARLLLNYVILSWNSVAAAKLIALLDGLDAPTITAATRLVNDL
jgi:hypothetical protein